MSTTITPEERAKLRKEICLETRGINSLLDALEVAEAQIDFLTDVSQPLLVDLLNVATARAEAAERERNWLAAELVNRTACLHDRWPGKMADDKMGYIVFTSKEAAIASVLEWAKELAGGA